MSPICFTLSAGDRICRLDASGRARVVLAQMQTFAAMAPTHAEQVQKRSDKSVPTEAERRQWSKLLSTRAEQVHARQVRMIARQHGMLNLPTARTTLIA